MKQAPLSLVCIEPTFPGHLGSAMDWLVRRRGYRCQFYCAKVESEDRWPSSTGRGLDVIQFKLGGVAREAGVSWTRSLERSLCYAYGCYEVLQARRPRGIDLVVGRSDFLGSTLFASVALPHIPVVNLIDYWLSPHAHDLTAEVGTAAPAEYFHWRRTSHAFDLLELENATAAWTPSHWQKSLFPPEYRDHLFVQHAGVDARRFWRHDRNNRTVAGRTIPATTKVVTFVARHLDQLRGFDRFVALANRLLAIRQDILFLVVGGSPVQRSLDVRYNGSDYQQIVIQTEPLVAPDQFFFLGPVAPAGVSEVLGASDLHVYPSRPYPIARSLLEAMASECAILAWDSAAVRDVVHPGQTGVLVTGEDMETIGQQAAKLLADGQTRRELGRQAAAFVRAGHDQDVCLPRLAAWFNELVNMRR